jgi:Holliday junction resolvasome RuvABC endonuclease subunit
MNIIAFDLGKHFAWAWRYVGMGTHTGVVCAGTIELDGIRSHRMGQLMRLLPEVFNAHHFDLVVYETPFARGRDATRSLWGIAGIIEAVATNAGVAVLDVATPTIKKFATGHGKACKEDMIAAAQKFGYRGTNEHEADASCLLAYAEANAERTTK